MIKLRDLIAFKFNSSLLRGILSMVYREDHFYKIPFGALRGTKLYYRKDINFHATMGVWEGDSLRVLKNVFRNFDLTGTGKVVADVGANIGYYSLFFSKYLHPATQIFAFEPSTSILPVLRKNLMINNVSNVNVLELACADHTGNEEFFLGEHHHESSLLREWSNNATGGIKTIVASITLDHFFETFNQGCYPDLIKMDIEGGGIFALKGCVNCISRKRPFVLIESHTPGEDQAVGHILQHYNYEAFRISNAKWVLHQDRNYKDPDGVWGTMLLIPVERKAAFID
jgi:FkbM family methyltransferase